MKTESFAIQVRFRGKLWEIPVRIVYSNLGRKIAAVWEGKEICFERDDHDGLRAFTHQEEFDPELLFQIGRSIQEQCL